MIIGIIGGGQLGMMMAETAKKNNHKIIGLDPNGSCSLSHIADEIIVAEYNDKKAFDRLANNVDVITYEFENVDLELVEKYIDKIPQKSMGLLKSRNRLTEKEFARSLDIPTVRYDIFQRDNLFYPAIIKTITGGYDGKGQYIINNIDDALDIPSCNEHHYIIEQKVDFDYEISVIATRDSYRNVVTYPIPVNSHRSGILFTSSVFNELDSNIERLAKSYTVRIINELDYVGTLAVEFFVRENEVIFNEFAPRPHNSGHYTIEGCNVSQFENHILAITNERIIEPKLLNPTIMINILGQDVGYEERGIKLKCYYHDYFKVERRDNRKMGHITIVKNNKSHAIKEKNTIIKESL